MMKRFVDISRHTFDASVSSVCWRKDTDICVVCPKCDKMGIVKTENGQRCFVCQHCFEKKVQSRFIHAHKVEEQCSHCERFFRVEIPREKHQFKVLNVDCPHCNTMISGKVKKFNQPWYDRSRYQNPTNESIFNYPLYFLDYLDDKPIWALNREHLQYLIDYIEADLREKAVVINPHTGNSFVDIKGQSYQLPKFMKLAKNRDKVLKILRRMQVN